MINLLPSHTVHPRTSTVLGVTVAGVCSASKRDLHHKITTTTIRDEYYFKTATHNFITMTNLSPVTMNISNVAGIYSFSRIIADDQEEFSCGSTMLTTSPCDVSSQDMPSFWVKDLSYDSPKQNQQTLSSEVLKFMTPRRKRHTGSRLPTFGAFSPNKELLTISDLRRLPRSPERRPQWKTQDTTVERFNHSTGEINEGLSSCLPKSSNFLRMPLSAGANDIASWTQTSRRRRRRGKLLQGVSPSLRSLPRELELQLDDEDQRDIRANPAENMNSSIGEDGPTSSVHQSIIVGHELTEEEEEYDLPKEPQLDP